MQKIDFLEFGMTTYFDFLVVKITTLAKPLVVGNANL